MTGTETTLPDHLTTIGKPALFGFAALQSPITERFTRDDTDDGGGLRALRSRKRFWSSVIPTSTIIKNTFPTHHSIISQC
ncbi:hypothetical protein CDV31_006283 [Fusarium ambrosium]|uniref:Uncharacterized protein n=1 Tax=Fusarium ambrosium TaxID=131363 RepID=A0A428UDV8_9HYPO|nr:hypothetical protein CDV31_006283 [Fusarium ambrosium]